MTRCFAFILLNLLIATPVAAEPNSETGTTTVERKEQCQKHCMGDNTPTEKANCLA